MTPPEERQRRSRWRLVIVLSVALIAGIAVWRHGPDTAPPPVDAVVAPPARPHPATDTPIVTSVPSSATAAPDSTADKPTPSPAIAGAAPADRALSEDRDALDRIARRYVEHERRRAEDMLLGFYGEAYTEVILLPIEEAWPLLESMALQGDAAAVEILTARALECRDRGYSPAAIATFATRVDPADAALLTATLTLAATTKSRVVQTCEQHGLGAQRLAWLRDRPGYPKNAAAVSSGELRAFRGADGTFDEHAMLAILAHLASHPRLMDYYSLCRDVPCRMAEDLSLPPPSDDWLRSAAALGTAEAIERVADAARAAGDVVEASAWQRYRVWLDRQGCTPFISSDIYMDMLMAHRAEANLTLSQRAAATARTDEIVAVHGALALQFQRCGG